MVLKDIRNKFNLSQAEAASIVHVPLRTYIRYESDNNYGDELKRQRMMELILGECEITETKGLLTIEQIKSIVTEVFNSKYQNEVEYCYLFGSYAKGYANDSSDVDLFVSTSLITMPLFPFSNMSHFSIIPFAPFIIRKPLSTLL